MNKELLDTISKISDTICVVSGNLLCPSYHGVTKYNHVNAKLREMLDMVDKLKESVSDE